jgi:hypothetical protein
MEITLQVSGQELRYVLDTRYRTVDPVAGELRQSLVIAPPVFTDFANPVLMFATNQPKSVPVRVIASTGPVKGQLKLTAPDGWHVDPATVQIDLKGANAETVAAFTVKPPEQDSEERAGYRFYRRREYSFGRVRISYPPLAFILMRQIKVVRADIRKKGERIGYIPGAGDDVPESLQQIGYTVKMLTDGDITEKNLAQFSVVVLGIRAYNTDDRISTWLPKLFAYVKNGGVAIAQYNTTADLKTKEIAPYLLEISRVALRTKMPNCAFWRHSSADP